MSDGSLIASVVSDVFGEHCAPERLAEKEGKGFASELWEIVAELGLTLASVPESSGGAGAPLEDACTILRAAGRHAVPLPLVETGLLAGWLLSEAGLDVGGGPLSVAPVRPAERIVLSRRDGRAVIDGAASCVPWASVAETIVVVAEDGDQSVLAAVPRERALVEPGSSIAGEPLDTVRFDGAPLDGIPTARLPLAAEAIRARGALGYATLMLGALERVRDLTFEYASQREQFGRPIGRFQAVQQHVAQIARDVAVARAAVESAIAHAAAGDAGPSLEVAAAKVACDRAAGSVPARAHQVHGAIGITKEYPLQLFTRRLWSWRDIHGSESEWARWTGQTVLDTDQDLWTAMTVRG